MSLPYVLNAVTADEARIASNCDTSAASSLATIPGTANGSKWMSETERNFSAKAEEAITKNARRTTPAFFMMCVSSALGGHDSNSGSGIAAFPDHGGAPQLPSSGDRERSRHP